MAHLKVCELAWTATREEHRQLLSLLWEGIQAGASRPDAFRMPARPGDRQGAAQPGVAHRCYVDSDDPKDRGCPAEISRYATGTVSFIEGFACGELEGTRDGPQFCRKCGSFFGVIAHLVADLWTPPHLGRNLQPSDLRHGLPRGLHRGVEADQEKAAEMIEGPLEHRLQQVPLDGEHYARLAARLYRRLYLRLPLVYGKNRWGEDVRRFAEGCIAGAAATTADVWFTIATGSPVEAVVRRAEGGGA